jgi:hypothetical protein
MGYNTIFTGHLKITPRMKQEDVDAFNDVFCASQSPHPILARELVGDAGRTTSVFQCIDMEIAYRGETPVLYFLDTEKMYNMDIKLLYVIEHFFKRFKYKLNGTIEASGDEPGDWWCLVVKNNVVTKKDGRMVYDKGVRLK